jgi:hypothetical protein
VLAVPSLCEFYPGICPTTEGKAHNNKMILAHFIVNILKALKVEDFNNYSENLHKT